MPGAARPATGTMVEDGVRPARDIDEYGIATTITATGSTDPSA